MAASSPEPHGKQRRQVLLVGWDAADWKFALPLLEAGYLPAIASLVERGVMGNIATLQPPLSPMLWASIATGKLADKHGILGFLEPDPLNSELGVRPVSVTSRKVPAIWNLLDRHGLDAHVVGWYATHPAESLRGVTVSDQFFTSAKPEVNKPWLPPAASVAPAELTESLASLVTHPAQITKEQLREFVPELDRIDQLVDPRPALLAEQLARAASRQSIATAILQNEPWDFLAVYFDGIDVLGHHFMPYHPPRMEGVSPRDFELYASVMTRVYQLHDMMLARLLQLAGANATVLLVSDHGFHSGSQRPSLTSGVAPAALDASWHRAFGLFCAAGPGLKKDERIYGASILDLTPTILTLFNLPIGEDMDGRVITDTFETLPPIQRVATLDTPSPNQLPNESSTPPSSTLAAVEQLVALGYIEPLSTDARRNAEQTAWENQLNLAVVYLSTGRPALAQPIIQASHAERPTDERALLYLAQCLHDLGQASKCAELLEQHAASFATHSAHRSILLGSAMLALTRAPEAARYFAEAEKLEPRSANPILLHGSALLAQREWTAAELAFRRALSLDDDNPEAYDGLAVSFLEQRRFHEAARAALEAAGRLHYFPAAHFHLGQALAGMGDYARALQAFEASLSIAPDHHEAHRWAATMRRELGSQDKAAEHLQAITKA